MGFGGLMFYIYNEQGDITQSAQVSDEAAYREILTSKGLTFLESDAFIYRDITDLYVVDGQVVERPLMEIAVNPQGNTLTLSNIPMGANLAVDTQAIGTIDDGVAEFEFAEAGSYDIYLFCRPYKNWFYKFEVASNG